MILYFSGTGNSQWAALRLAEALGDDVVSINRSMKEGAAEACSSEQPLVFVVPTYAWRMPRVVDRWIRSARFEGSRDAYFVLTCAGSCGNAAAYARKLCSSVGLRFRELAPVVMPENYLALYDTSDARRVAPSSSAPSRAWPSWLPSSAKASRFLIALWICVIGSAAGR